MADIINLKQIRKARARATSEEQAARNRVAFGRTKAEKQATKADAARAARRLDGVLREVDSPETE